MNNISALSWSVYYEKATWLCATANWALNLFKSIGEVYSSSASARAPSSFLPCSFQANPFAPQKCWHLSLFLCKIWRALLAPWRAGNLNAHRLWFFPCLLTMKLLSCNHQQHNIWHKFSISQSPGFQNNLLWLTIWKQERKKKKAHFWCCYQGYHFTSTRRHLSLQFSKWFSDGTVLLLGTKSVFSPIVELGMQTNEELPMYFAIRCYVCM